MENLEIYVTSGWSTVDFYDEIENLKYLKTFALEYQNIYKNKTTNISNLMKNIIKCENLISIYICNDCCIDEEVLEEIRICRNVNLKHEKFTF